MVHGSWLKANGSRLMAHGQVGLARPWGQAARGPHPWALAMSHEPRALSHEPRTISNQLIHRLMINQPNRVTH